MHVLIRLSIVSMLLFAGRIEAGGIDAYRDKDSEARIEPLSKLGVDPKRHKTIDDAISDSPKNAKLLATKGYLLALRGLEAESARAYTLARAVGRDARHVAWSEGWARYFLNDAQGAISHWNEAIEMHGGRPRWVPETLALAQWKLGEGATALEMLETGDRSQISISLRTPQPLHTLLWAPSARADLAQLREVARLRDASVPRSELGLPAFQVPELVAGDAPAYPSADLRAQHEGTVLAAFCVSPTAVVSRREIPVRSDQSGLNKAVEVVFATWKFTAARCNGSPVSSWVFVPVEFDAQTAGGERRAHDADKGYCMRSGQPAVTLDHSGWNLAVAECPQVDCSSSPLPEIERCAQRDPIQRPPLTVTGQFVDQLRRQ